MPGISRIFSLLLLAAAGSLMACSKHPEIGIMSTGNFADTSGVLKTAADFPIGVAVNNGPLQEAPFLAITQRDFSSVTFGYEMKHGAVVQNDGSLNFNTVDAMLAKLGNITVFGHTLCWHSNQNATYLKNYAGIIVPAATELATNPGFESGLNNWSIFNTNGATITATNVATEVHSGSGAMKVVNPTANPGNQWKVQVSSAAFATTPGKSYVISYWVKAANAGGSIRLSSGPTAAQYQGDQTIGTTWQQVSWNITASLASTTFLFDMGQAANTYYIDDVSVKEAVVAPGQDQIGAKLDAALNDFITKMVTRYKDRVHAWDVYNEPFSDNPVALRSNVNTDISPTDVLVWSNYMGRDAAYKAFKYAAAADPSADLYINDYNLESNQAKLDSLLAFVKELKARGCKVDGIGTQMHISRTTNLGGIDIMMRKLAASGLKIRISELDVKTVAGSAAGQPTAQLLAYQAVAFKYAVASYVKYIPKAQQAGITIWGINDRNSWLYKNGTEFPLLYDNDYHKKPAYGAVIQALQGK
ncbi:endo-1,4-beta-xylanase [Chitinophaga dinghuensis]|uniref:Beta-xylanase n=1 Tax=Chitinophaga dinghuensis TaxID=1539050 RepID=A0A327VW72_9BACT|nr:endo-1,4-beta-xylanase [Chitinophaga dinghuensis]RAJ79084.1 endo-1,4-beta-xylanase [Chitinophaga dinghuensis]